VTRRCASRRQADDLDDPAASSAASARDAPQLSFLARSGLASAEPCEEAVDVRHWPLNPFGRLPATQRSP
jgi:hypothetical protein